MSKASTSTDVSASTLDEVSKSLAEAVKNADFTPWQLIFLMLGIVLLMNAKGIYQIHVQKYETKRKYNNLDKKTDHKLKLMEEKLERKSKFKGNGSLDSEYGKHL
ncbi:hypothetical protein [Actibacterium sp. XHP0104]|uniref:hypothetical protein n=1 Tax=Actibacterium sp. XHP0104 TaxID=2984335 RepID=UPI0021E8A9A3|nr:hypothetical protein [Actibacterium sp. XHP0104]MCV2880561.1 hypothetical protein [Actibacterium sp. XHP0104]